MSNHPPGTLICDESEIMEQQVVTGIAFSKDEAQISIRQVPDKPGVAAAIFGPLAEANINVDMIVQNVSADGADDRPDLHGAGRRLRARRRRDREVARTRSATIASTARPTSPRSR